jgi:hypothetical protein
MHLLNGMRANTLERAFLLRRPQLKTYRYFSAHVSHSPVVPNTSVLSHVTSLPRHRTPFPLYSRQNCAHNVVDLFTIPFGAAALVLPWRLPIALTAYASTSTESHEFDAERRVAFMRVSNISANVDENSQSKCV